MRNTIVNLIYEEAKKNPNLYFLTGDLGYSVIDSFQKEFPERCINAGIAEQNMVGMAAGLALEGKKVFVYSIVPFATMRCMEQIRNDVALQNLDVTVIGVGGGFAYGASLGPTHYAIEEVAMLRAIPRMKILAPSDPASAAVLFKQVLAMKGPFYIRLNKGGEPIIYPSPPAMEFGKGFVVKEGNQVSILATGALVFCALAAAKLLEAGGLSVEVVDMATVKPLDADLVKNRIASRKLVVTVEEHNIMGGFGSAVAEVVAENTFVKMALFRRLGVNDIYTDVFGSQDFMRSMHNLTADKIFQTVKRMSDKL